MPNGGDRLVLILRKLGEAVRKAPVATVYTTHQRTQGSLLLVASRGVSIGLGTKDRKPSRAEPISYLPATYLSRLDRIFSVTRKVLTVSRGHRKA